MVLGVSGQLEWADRDAVLAVLAGAFLGQVLLPSLTVPSSTQTLYRVLFIFGTPQEPGLVLCDASMTGEMNVLSQGSPPFSTTEDLLAQHNISSFCTGNCAPPLCHQFLQADLLWKEKGGSVYFQVTRGKKGRCFSFRQKVTVPHLTLRS